MHKVMVDPAGRGMGIGTQLCESLLRELDARDARAFLTVRPDNAAALRL